MSWLLDQLCQIFVNIIVALGGFLIHNIVQPLSISPSVFLTYFPVAEDYVTVFQTLSLVMLVAIVWYQIIRIITRNDQLTETDAPVTLGIRTFVAVIMIFMSINIMSNLLSAANTQFNNLKLSSAWSGEQTNNAFAINTENDSDDVLSKGYFDFLNGTLGDQDNDYAQKSMTDFLETAPIVAIDTIKTVISIVQNIIKIVLVCIITFKLFMFLLEILERYLLLMVLSITSPLIWCTFASKSTINIFKSWLQLVMSTIVLAFLNMFFLRLIMEGISNMFVVTAPADANWAANPILACFLVLAMIRLAQQADNHLGRIMTTASTGAGLGQELIGAAMTLGFAVRGISHIANGTKGSYQKHSGSAIPETTAGKYPTAAEQKAHLNELQGKKNEALIANDATIAGRNNKSVGTANPQAALNTGFVHGSDPKIKDFMKSASKIAASDDANGQAAYNKYQKALGKLDKAQINSIAASPAMHNLDRMQSKALLQKSCNGAFRAKGFRGDIGSYKASKDNSGNISFNVAAKGRESVAISTIGASDTNVPAFTPMGSSQAVTLNSDSPREMRLAAANAGSLPYADVEFECFDSPESAQQQLEGNYGIALDDIQSGLGTTVRKAETNGDGYIEFYNNDDINVGQGEMILNQQMMDKAIEDHALLLNTTNTNGKGRGNVIAVRATYDDIGVEQDLRAEITNTKNELSEMTRRQRR